MGQGPPLAQDRDQFRPAGRVLVKLRTVWRDCTSPLPFEPIELLATKRGKPGQAVAIAAVRDFPEEGLQVLADDGVENGVLGVAGLIRAVGMRHAQG